MLKDKPAETPTRSTFVKTKTMTDGHAAVYRGCRWFGTLPYLDGAGGERALQEEAG